MRAKTYHLAYGNVGEVGLPAEWLTPVDIREMDFNHGDRNGKNGISEGNARVRVRRRIENQHIRLWTVLMDPVDQCPLVVGLPTIKGMLFSRGLLL